MDISKTYQKKSDKQHVLDNPDTYTGSMEMNEIETYVYSDETESIVSKSIQYIPGLYKLFDEGIVNCRDHQVRMEQAKESGDDNVHQVTYIHIDITDEGVISFTNDGNGIDVVEHPEYKIMIPEMIFGHLRTSTNYDKSEKKIVGGKNGFGFKLVLIWSQWGMVETVDHKRKLKYVQEFSDNLNEIHKYKITKCSKKPYTKVSFKPDFKRLGIENLSKDILDLFKRRIYDIAAVTDKKVKVSFNGNLVPVTNYQNYVDKYIGVKSEKERCYEKPNDRWEYVVSLAPKEEFTQVSFVNGIYTGKGGKHVEYILNQIVRKMIAFIQKKKKIDVKPNTIKEQLMLFIRCDIDNPSFDSQSKDFMNTPIGKFGSSCEVSDKFIEKIAKMGIMDVACQLTHVKQHKDSKKTDGSKNKNIRGIHKLIDANLAGTNKSGSCILILCEGDSAKAGIVSGLSREDRNIIGVYPMRGKLLNVRGENIKKISENKEIHELKQIMGLENGFKYNKDNYTEKLRYGRILFMTDQDLDGSHIKGLCINLFDSQWQTLLEIPNFIGFMNTPILKARKGKKEISFYNDGEYNSWKEVNDSKGWSIKYYKGLGTSTGKEFKEYFEKKKNITFCVENKDCLDSIDKVFNKKRAIDRKEWLEGYDRKAFIDTSKDVISYKEFIKKEMIHFSKYDCERSIPNIMDGMKTSQRKIIYSAFKRRLHTEIKVAQFAGYVSEHSSYHHGEQSLNGAIVNMAQNYVGSNNINVLEPKGQFGTRIQGGKDSASERYIFTKLNKITRMIYKEEDDVILDYINDDGTIVEPVHYAPIIPMILVNGSKGIGTGFSTEIMCYDPLIIIDYIQNVLKGKSNDSIDFIPYYQGYKGTIDKITENKFIMKGIYKVEGNKVHITELPVGTWTDDYKEFIEKLMDGGKTNKPIVKDYNDMSTDQNIDITIVFTNGSIKKLQETKTEYENCNGLDKYLKMYTSKSTTNMHMFDETEKLKKFNKINEIIDYYIDIRLGLYLKRKESILKILEKEVMILQNKKRFITEILEDVIDLRKKNKIQIHDMLKGRKYDMNEDYKYLIQMPMDSVTEENIIHLNEIENKKSIELQEVKDSTPHIMWNKELEILKKELIRTTPSM